MSDKYGPQTIEIEALIARAKVITDDESRSWYAAWYATQDSSPNAAWDAARDAALDAAWDAAWDAARDVADDAAWDAVRSAADYPVRDAALALLVRDLISEDDYDLLTRPWRQAIGPIHSDDIDIKEVRP